MGNDVFPIDNKYRITLYFPKYNFSKFGLKYEYEIKLFNLIENNLWSLFTRLSI